MTKTTTELADAVLYDLAIADRNETPDTTDRTQCTDAYANVWEELNAEGRKLVYWPQAEIPLPVFNIMRDLVRIEVQGHFGMPVSIEEREGRRDLILRRLYRHTRMATSKLPTRINDI